MNKKEILEGIIRLIEHTEKCQTKTFKSTDYGKGFMDGLYHVKQLIEGVK